MGNRRRRPERSEGQKFIPGRGFSSFMFSINLLDYLRCPTHHARLSLFDEALICPRDGELFPLRSGYVELVPRASFEHTTLYNDDQGGQILDYREIGPPLLSAKIKNDLLNEFLHPAQGDVVLDLGCGNGKFAYWNRGKVKCLLALDLAPWFADKVLAEVPLIRGDMRVLPFDDATFDKIYSVDVLEHLTTEDIASVLDEAHRVLSSPDPTTGKPGGRFFIFSNTRERQTLWWLMAPQKALTNFLQARGLIDFRRDDWRKSDHVKAIATYEQLRETLAAHGFTVRHVVFWNGVFQGWIENVVMKLGESWLSRGARGKDALERQVAARRQVRANLNTRPRMHYALLLKLMTALMGLDLKLFGRLRAGPYFLLVEKV